MFGFLISKPTSNVNVGADNKKTTQIVFYIRLWSKRSQNRYVLVLLVGEPQESYRMNTVALPAPYKGIGLGYKHAVEDVL